LFKAVLINRNLVIIILWVKIRNLFFLDAHPLHKLIAELLIPKFDSKISTKMQTVFH